MGDSGVNEMVGQSENGTTECFNFAGYFNVIRTAAL